MKSDARLTQEQETRVNILDFAPQQMQAKKKPVKAKKSKTLRGQQRQSELENSECMTMHSGGLPHF